MREATRVVIARLTPAGFELLILVLLLVAGLKFVAGAPTPGSVNATFPDWLRIVWGWIILTGSLLSVGGLAFGRDLVHAFGMWLISWVAFFYAVAVMSHSRPGSWLQAVIDLALCLVAGYQAVSLQRRSQ